MRLLLIMSRERRLKPACEAATGHKAIRRRSPNPRSATECVLKIDQPGASLHAGTLADAFDSASPIWLI